MKSAFLSSIAAILLGAGIATAQGPIGTDSPYQPALSVQEQSAGVASKDVAPNLSPPGDGVRCGVDWRSACAPCCPTPCGPPGTFWASADYLLWWTKSSSAPPLVTTSPAASGGVVGPGTTVLAGGSDMNSDPSSGLSFSLGFWIDEDHTVGLEGGGLFLGSRSNDFSVGGDGAVNSPTIGRPFFNVLSGREDSELVAAPGVLAGTVGVHSSSRLAGGDINGIFNLACACDNRLDVIGGFRYLQLNDGLGITEDLTAPPGPGGTSFVIQDQFDTSDRFYGGQIGLRDEVRRGRFFADFTGQIAFGAVDEIVDIQGSTVITPPGGAAVVRSGGLLALPTNIGHYTQSRFAVLPEAGLDLGYQLTDHVRVSTGYNFLYLSNVVRPGDQIDRVLNPTQLPVLGGAGGLVGPPRPAFDFHETDYWAQGIQFGLEFRY